MNIILVELVCKYKFYAYKNGFFKTNFNVYMSHLAYYN